MRHHYVPQFLLRRSTGAKGKLRVYPPELVGDLPVDERDE
jgi:hypothetical protein